MVPTIQEFYADPAANVLVSVERLLTLAVPNTYFWLLSFYAYFHLTLNLLAEVPPAYGPLSLSLLVVNLPSTFASLHFSSGLFGVCWSYNSVCRIIDPSFFFVWTRRLNLRCS